MNTRQPKRKWENVDEQAIQKPVNKRAKKEIVKDTEPMEVPKGAASSKEEQLREPVSLAIVGGRDFTDYKLLCEEVNAMYGDPATSDFGNVAVITAIISGGAAGADTLGARYAREMNLPLTVFKPDWKTHGNKAGILRNKNIVDAATVLIAFWDGKSRGTEHTISLARKSKKLLKIVRY